MVQNQTLPVDFNTAATQTLIPALAGRRIVVFGYVLVNGVATGQSVQFRSGTNNLSGVMQLPLSVGASLSETSSDEQIALLMTDPGVALTMVQSAATQVGGHISFKYS